MGRQSLGAVIRKLDYIKVKHWHEYDDEDDYPGKKLDEFYRECKADITFDELKDAFSAFESKVCAKDFPESLKSAGYKLAEKTLNVLGHLMCNYVDDHGEKTDAASEVYLHTSLTILKADLKSSHLKLIEGLLSGREPRVADYFQKIEDKQPMVQILTALKVTIKGKPDKACEDEDEDEDEDETYGHYISSCIQDLLHPLSKKQLKLVQTEFLDVYRHFLAQLAHLSGKLAEEIRFSIEKMLEHYDAGNHYIGFKDSAMIKQHLTSIKDLVCSDGHYCDCPKDVTATSALEKLFNALTKDTTSLGEVFDLVMAMIVELTKNPTVQKEGERIFDVIRFELFGEMEKKVKPTSAILNSCNNMIVATLPYCSVKFVQEMIEAAHNGVVKKAPKMSAEEVNNVLKIIRAYLSTGRADLVLQARATVTKLVANKSLDWKFHMEEAKQILDAMGAIPEESMEKDRNRGLSGTVELYEDFLKTLLEQLKKSKVLSKLQPSLVKFFFDCLLVSTPLKINFTKELVTPFFDGLIDFSKSKADRLAVLQKCESMIKNKDLPWSDIQFRHAVKNILETVIESFGENGRHVSAEENKLFVSMFKYCEGGKSIKEQFYMKEDEESNSVYGLVYQNLLMAYCKLHKQTSTLDCVSSLIPGVLKWAKEAVHEDHEIMTMVTFAVIGWVGDSSPESIKDSLPMIVDLMLFTGKILKMFGLVLKMYPHNPKAVHDKLPVMFNQLEKLNTEDRSLYLTIFSSVSEYHPEVFTAGMIPKLIWLYQKIPTLEKPTILYMLKAIAETNPSVLADFLPPFCDEKLFKTDTMNLRSDIIAGIGGVNKKLGQQALDYLMKHVNYAFKDPSVQQSILGSINSIAKDNVNYMQKYKTRLKNLAETASVPPRVRHAAKDIILILEGKSVEKIAVGLQQQQEVVADLDVKVDATAETVVTIGDKVIEHDKEIGELGVGLEKVEERVEDVEENVGDTKVKVEGIDNKTMTNAPKWSRDLTKLMNPTAKNDWRLLASRLGYSNEDIRGWATQHDPCMALLSEWYATHKTSEASFGVLTALTEMNRMDGVAIVENAMKQAVGVVEDEDFEYPSPPPVFISYQWGFQNEVKLLKQHLNMAGYECWMDVGQMGGGDKLFAKIDNGIRGAKIVICCVTEKYAQSPNCNREVNLSVNLNKPIIPLLMEKMNWPPVGSMGPIFSEYLFVRFFQRKGDETGAMDQRYWPILKFQELLMQLNYFVIPDQKMVTKEYTRWWVTMVEDIVIDKNKRKKPTSPKKSQTSHSQVKKTEGSPHIFLSYQWGKQLQVRELYKRLTSLGYTVWMDIFQMGGGDSLYDKIDRGIRGCKAVVSCVTLKYSLSANCRREVSLADALKKPIIPLLLEHMKWPPDGPMSMVFTELLFINFYRDDTVQMSWEGERFDELVLKLGQFITDCNIKDNVRGKNNNPALAQGKSITAAFSATSKNESTGNGDTSKDIPKSTTTSKGKAVPNSKGQINSTNLEPTVVNADSSISKSSEASKSKSISVSSPKISAVNKLNTEQKVNKASGNSIEVKLYPDVVVPSSKSPTASKPISDPVSSQKSLVTNKPKTAKQDEITKSVNESVDIKQKPAVAASSPKSTGANEIVPKLASSPKTSFNIQPNTERQDEMSKIAVNSVATKSKTGARPTQTTTSRSKTGNETSKSKPGTSKACSVM